MYTKEQEADIENNHATLEIPGIYSDQGKQQLEERIASIIWLYRFARNTIDLLLVVLMGIGAGGSLFLL